MATINQKDFFSKGKVTVIGNDTENFTDPDPETSWKDHVKSLSQGIASPFLKAGATLGAATEGLYGLGKLGVGKAIGNEGLANSGRKTIMENDAKAMQGVDFGYFGKVKPIGTSDSVKKNIAESVGVGAQIGSTLVAPVSGAGKSLLAKTALGAAEGYAGDVAMNLADENVKGAANLKPGFGTLLGGALPVMGAGASKLGKGMQNTSNAIGGSGAAGAVKGAAVNFGKGVKSQFNPELSDAFIRAVKPGKNNTDFAKAVTEAMPIVDNIAKKNGIDLVKTPTLENVGKALDTSKKTIWKQFASKLGKGTEADLVIDGNKIADEMVASISKRTLTQNPALAERIQKVADTYRRALPVEEAEDFLQSVNGDLNTYYSKNNVGKKVAMTDPETAYLVKESDALRKGLYSILEEGTGADVKRLKQLYGYMANIQDEVAGRINVYNRQNPFSLSEQLNFAQGAGKVIKSAANMQFGDALEGIGQMAVTKAIKAKNAPEALIKSGISKMRSAKVPKK